MKHFCSVVTGYRNTKYGKRYKHCGKEAIYSVKDSDWYVCNDCAIYADRIGWKLKKLKGV